MVLKTLDPWMVLLLPVKPYDNQDGQIAPRMC
jgi:hypothetical protein